MKVLITGGCGFLGSNLAKRFLELGWDVLVIDGLYRQGSEKNLHWLRQQECANNLKFFKGDVSDTEFIETFFTNNRDIKYICHVAGQVAMTTSLKDPRLDMQTNIIGTFNLLEATRKYCPEALFAYSSTNKVYGDLIDLEIEETKTRYILKKFPYGLDENTPLDFSTPYGCSKGSADQYVRDWSRVYGLKTVVFRHSSIYGGRQYSTTDQGWIGWFCHNAIQQKKTLKNALNPDKFSIAGSGKQVRDVLHADDLVSLYLKAYENADIMNGIVFNIGGGKDNSLSLLELFSFLGEKLEIELGYYKLDRRKSDQDCFIADIRKAKRVLDWAPEVSYQQGISEMIKWCEIIDSGC